MGATEGTFHGTRERVSWAVTRNNSTQLWGEDEAGALADYEHRRKTLHRGETIALERRVVVESWIQRGDVIDKTVKPSGVVVTGTHDIPAAPREDTL